MNKQLKRVSVVVLAMFVALLVSTTYITGVQADSLRADPRNSRAILQSYSAQRGAIVVGGKAVAESVPSKDQYKFLRTYTDGALYAPITGYYTLGEGATGIENALNKQLSGKSNEQFFDQINSLLTGKDPEGASVNTTIDPAVQKVAYDALGNNTGAVVAIEPSTGKILAMVSKGSYDPNQLASHDRASVLKSYDTLLHDSSQPLINRAIAGDLYFPGSTFKLVVASAAFESGKYTKDSKLPNPATFTLTGTSTKINNAEGGACGGGSTVTIETALVDSCNIPFAELGEKLGYDAINVQAKKYGFDSAVSIPQTATPSVFPATGGDDATLELQSFGQGSVRETPLQVAMTTATIANGGKEMSPTLIDTIQNPDLSYLEKFKAKSLGSPISESTASTLTTLMTEVVAKGTGTNARISGVDVAGKTGTAQTGESASDPYTLWFTGFAPAANPKVAVAVVVGNGGGQGQSLVGNTAAAPIAKQVMEAVLNK
ncbi:cell division protein FtsI [Frondihabitans sp. PAMC 28766]|uniref:peptidoglycan D,D-transpeptidase FtsI family protein n=1 Tax=Frondihabitans sp. PAMC 28766 TaxID=1795630 RepID=UPI00078B9E0C|nr:penicillin-binding transpeptidase domain-containing protein [Frondihabitans sp. PAMC 28766]AMM19503.1 cell division protein FtsI [Frondihabitans sp. PAMC 28766]